MFEAHFSLQIKKKKGERQMLIVKKSIKVQVHNKHFRHFTGFRMIFELKKCEEAKV